MLALFLACSFALAPADTVGPRRTVVWHVSASEEHTADSWLGEDKFKHFAMSFGITSFAFVGARLITDRAGSIAVGIGTGVVAGVMKEVFDRRHQRSLSGRDLTWDALGVALGYVVIRQTN